MNEERHEIKIFSDCEAPVGDTKGLCPLYPRDGRAELLVFSYCQRVEQ
jgi:hypothetical protein